MKRLNVISAVLGLCASSAFAQTAVITTVGNGSLTFTNIASNAEYRIQWAPSGTNAVFNDLYNKVEYIAPTGTTMTIGVPVQFRVAVTNALSNGIVRASELPLNIPMGTNAKVDVEWSETSGGPWSTNWDVVLEQTSTGLVAVVPTPRFYRMSFINCASNWPNPPCTNWFDATAPDGDRTNFFCFGVACNFNYTKPCLKIKAGQSVTFTGKAGDSFFTVPFETGCQECGAMTNQNSGSTITFTFEKPGYFNYHAAPFFGDTNGNGMAGNVWVIP